MFFQIQSNPKNPNFQLLDYHQPYAFILENVKQLVGHNQGKTLKLILDILLEEEFPEVTGIMEFCQERQYTTINPPEMWQ